MSQLLKLRIQGMRSFGPEDADGQPMNFCSEEKDEQGRTQIVAWPLTLILGQNGCGKTTIIECLRYVTSGDHPPGSYQGKSFIHDPKMANEHTVRGSVKLRFRGTDGKVYQVLRQMEATQKPKSIATKSIDGQFIRLEDG